MGLKNMIGSIAQDKVLHVLGGAIVGAAVTIWWSTLGWLAVFAAAAIGALKEAFDTVCEGGTGWDWKDFIAACGGGMLIEIIWIIGLFW